MSVAPCTVRGERRFKVEVGVPGNRKRLFFVRETDARRAHRDAQKDLKDLGRAWAGLSAREKCKIMAILREIEAAGLTMEKAWLLAKSAKAGAASGTHCTLSRAVEEVLAAAKTRNCRPRHLKNLKWYLRLFIRGREAQDVCSIGERELNEWFAARQEAPRSQNGHRALLSILFEHCWRKRYVAENPVKRIQTVHVDRATPAVLTNLQSARALLWALKKRPKLLAWLILALFAGLRPEAEADLIDETMIDLKRGRIVITKSKVRHARPRIIDLKFCPPALPWLKLAKSIGWTLPLKTGTRRRYVRELGRELGLKRWPQDILRHTAASNLLAFHQDAGKVAEFLGNSAGVLLRDYKALIFREDAKASMKLLPKKRHHP